MPDTDLADAVTAWYAGAARDLPWRRPGTSPWAVLVSEVMLQQTPVARVLPLYDAWLARWPTATALAAAEPGEAVRLWGRLGYPRRALRLHAAAVVMVAEHGGEPPRSVPELLALPGVGDYTARAVAAFAHGQRQPVVDTNVRRVLARVLQGVATAPVTRRELARVADLLPPEPAAAVTASAALMELGAVVCTARAPRCPTCPVAARCSWLRRGRPGLDTPARPRPAYVGSDRQARGCLLAAVRGGAAPVAGAELASAWPESARRGRALAGLVADGLVELLPDGRFALPTTSGARSAT